MTINKNSNTNDDNTDDNNTSDKKNIDITLTTISSKNFFIFLRQLLRTSMLQMPANSYYVKASKFYQKKKIKLSL